MIENIKDLSKGLIKSISCTLHYTQNKRQLLSLKSNKPTAKHHAFFNRGNCHA